MDPHSFYFLDPDPHSEKLLDPDPQKLNAYPQPWVQRCEGVNDKGKYCTVSCSYLSVAIKLLY